MPDLRVLLFVQTGEGRVKCVWRSCAGERAPISSDGTLNWLRFKVGSQADCVATGTYPADRWWLVECENADAGRALIVYGITTGRGTRLVNVYGRILASGGKL